jgi:protein-S-isoprenylcysteine O-methyltransferase Ste14
MSEIQQETEIDRRDQPLRIHPPLFALTPLVLGLLVHLVGGDHQSAFPFQQLLGLLVVAAGTGLACYAAAFFAAANTTKNPYGEPAALVVLPPYTVTRNLMYVGLTTILFGFTIFFGSPAMLLAPIVFVIVIDRMVIPREEATMERIYGQPYCDYRNRVPRWLRMPSLQLSSSPAS